VTAEEESPSIPIRACTRRSRRDADRTPVAPRTPPGGRAWAGAPGECPSASERPKRRRPSGRLRAVNAFHVCGILFAAWALIVSFLGITRENFPATNGAARAVGTISVLLAAAAIGTAIYTSATEDEEGGGGGEQQALVVGF
jgi:hypothetical protein